MTKGKGKMKGKEGESLGKDSNTGALGEQLPCLLCPEASPLELVLSAQRKRIFRRGTSSPAAALPYLRQNQTAVLCSSSPKMQQCGSNEEKGPKASGTVRHNKEKAKRHRQNSPCALSHSFRPSCQKKHSYLLPIFCSASHSSSCDMGEKSPALPKLPSAVISAKKPHTTFAGPPWSSATTLGPHNYLQCAPSFGSMTQTPCCHARPIMMLVSSPCFAHLLSSTCLLR